MNKILCLPEHKRKEQWPHRRLIQTCPWVSKSPWWRPGSVVACCRVGDTECGNACMEAFERGCPYLCCHYLQHILASGQKMMEHTTVHQQKIELNIYWAWPCLSEQDSVSPSVRLSHQEGSMKFKSLSIRGPTERKPQSLKNNPTDHTDHSLV